MATAQQQKAFDPKAAARFAGIWAGWDTGNASEEEAMSKGRAVRRMVAERKLRIIDALELPEIRRALDDQMQPVRQAAPDVAALRAEAEDLRAKLAVVVPRLRELAEALKEERQSTVALLVPLYILGMSGVVSAVTLGNAWLIGTDAACLLFILAMCFWDGIFERRCMDTWQMVKEKALLAYGWASQIVFGLNVLLYIACCVVAGGPVGPLAYIAFLYHCCQWKVS